MTQLKNSASGRGAASHRRPTFTNPGPDQGEGKLAQQSNPADLISPGQVSPLNDNISPPNNRISDLQSQVSLLESIVDLDLVKVLISDQTAHAR